MTYRIHKAFLLFLMVSLMTLGASAQNANSAIQGTVKDVSGAVVSGATVTLTNIGTSQVLTTTSRNDGFYTFTSLSPTNYKISVTASGFANWVGVLTLRVSQNALVDATLNAASVATQVTVQDVTPIIDSVDPTLSDVKNATAISTIPVQNRSILNVLAFSPGVVANNYGGSGGGYTRVNGIIGGSLDYLVDGQTMVNHWSNELQSTPPSTLTFQEVKIMTTGGEAEYGRPGEVELVTKPGTNNFHGQIFELNKNQYLQAKTFNSGPTVPFLQHNEYGAQLGGPVWIPKVYNGRDKTFFFFDIEWIKNNQNAVEQYIVPTAAQTGAGGNGADLSTVFDTNGNLINDYDPNSTVYDPVTDTYTRTQFSYNGAPNVIPPNRLNPSIQTMFGNTPSSGFETYPKPNINNPNIWQYTPNYEPPSSKSTSNEKQITAKVDQIFGPNRLAARYTYTDQNQLTPLYYAPTAPDIRQNGGDNGSLTLTTALGPRAINVAHIGVQYNHAFRGPQTNTSIIGALGLPAYTDLVSWPGFYWFYGNDNYWTSLDRDNPQDYPNQIISGSDQFSYNRGNHQFMFGFEVDNSRITTYEIGQPGGNYSFDGSFTGLQDPSATNPDGSRNYGIQLNDTGGSLAQLLIGDVSQAILSIYPHYHTRQTEYSGFAQDSWRVTQNLTLTYGLRYEYWTPFSDSSGLLSTLNPNVTGGEVVYAGSGPLPAQTPQAVYDSFVAAGLPIESAAAAHYPLSLFTMPKNNFEPRVGFAYQLNSKTVLRGSWGIYQWVMPLQQFQQATRKNPPFSYSTVIQPGEINGATTSTTAAELEFPVASGDFGGPQPVNQFMLGSQNCTNQPAGTCNDPGLLLNTSNVSVSLGNGFGIVSMNPNVKPSTVQEYNLTFGRELPWHTGFQLSYIGNYQTNLLQFDPINANVPRNLCAVAGSTNVAQCQAGNVFFQRPYTNFISSGNGNYDENDYNGYGNSNELQAQITHTWGNGLTLQSYFTWGKYLQTTGGVGRGQGLLGAGGNTDVPAALTPGFNLANPLTSGASLDDRIRAVYSNDPSLPTKTFQLNAHYQFPFGKGQQFLGNAHGIVNALVSGYNISPFFLWHSGFYFAPYASAFGSNTVSQASGGRGIMLAPGKTGILPEGQRTTQQWFDASVWDPSSGNPYAGQTYQYTVTPQQGDFRNNIPFNYMTGPGFNELDASVYKLTPLWRNLVFDMEAQFFNVYNHQNLGMPNTHGIITNTMSGSTPRTIQLQAKFLF
jgi:hypothetical protein